MFRLNLKIALRNLWKNKSYSLINILGLSIGMACCILIFIYVSFQLSFDRDFENKDRIYRFVTDWKYNSFEDNSAGVPIPLIGAARNDIAGLEKVAGILRDGGVVIVKDEQGKEKIKEDKFLYYTDPEFFDIFNVNWLYGNQNNGLADPNTVVLAESMAQKYFGVAKSAMGKPITINGGTLKVVGVFKDMPQNSSFPLKVVVSFQTYYAKNNKDWESVSSSNACYALLKKGTTLADLQAPLAKFNEKYNKGNLLPGNQSNRLQSLKDIHFDERYGSFGENTITKKEIYGLIVIGLFLLLTACINFINLATAQSINRSKEVGVRKVMGSARKQLIFQFLTETLAITLIALLIACVLSELSIPLMEKILNNKVHFSLFKNQSIFIFMTGLVVLVSFLAGFYPALVISGFNPALAIKNKVTVNAGGLSLRKILVVVQFAITVVLIIGTLVIMDQMEYMRKKPLGFNTQSIAMVGLPNDSASKAKRGTLKERILKVAGVEMVSYCTMAPMSNNLNTTSFSFNGQQNKDFEVRLAPSDENYFKLFGLQLIAGKAFAKSDSANAYVVNETFLKQVNISDPQQALGKIIDQNGRRAPIVGVVKDFNDQSLQQRISPLAIYPESRRYYTMALKIDNNQMMSAMKQVAQIWNDTFPQEVYYAQFLNESINNYYEAEKTLGMLFKVFAGIIIFISFIGLFGLISFVAAQRTRELAIRKVLGASTQELVKMLNSSFLWMVFVANLVAWPLAYLFVSGWLSGFAYRIDLSVWPFVWAMLISMVITLITVSIRSYRAAKANTIDALKYE